MIIDDGWYVGDVPRWDPNELIPTAPPEQYYWSWNPLTRRLELLKYQTLTTTAATANVPDMARSEVIEYTAELDGEDSTSVAHLWYNANTETLAVEFKHSPGIYTYDGVDEELWNDFIDAESLGQFFHKVFQPKDGERWPGAKHDPRRVSFLQIEREYPDAEPDLDALKPQAITTGKGHEFTLGFRYSANGEMKVRGKDVDEAIHVLREYLEEHGFHLDRVTSATMTIKLPQE